MAKKHTYRIVFHNQGKLYELYARHVSHGEMYGFIEVGDIIRQGLDLYEAEG